MSQGSVAVAELELAEERLGFFRWGSVGDRVVVTNDAGEWLVLSAADFRDLLAGRIVEGHPRYVEVQGKSLLRDGLDLDGLATKIARRSRHVSSGPHLHVVTLADGTPAGNMSRETADRIIDLALESTAPTLAFELQAGGGEPLHNLESLRYLVEQARSRNQRGAGKVLTFRLFSNLSAMSEEAAAWLIANDVMLSTTLDGPAALHDEIRRWRGGSPHPQVVGWIDHFHRQYTELRRDPALWRVDARILITRATLGSARAVVDEYVARGLRTIHLRPATAALVDAETWQAIGYSVDEYLAFYREALDYILELNRRGVEIAERLASILLTKMLTADDPAIVDLQSPCGDGSGQLAYDVEGRIFPSDHGRWIGASGDPMFELGRVGSVTVADVLRHPTVRALAAASLLDTQPQCADCWNKPFCGISAVTNYLTQGDLFGQRAHCVACREQLALSTRLLELLSDESDEQTKEILQRWTGPALALSGGGRAASVAP